MKQIVVENLKRVKKAVPIIEAKTKIKISFARPDKINISGQELNEFIVAKVIKAVDFGFDVEDALLLKNPDFSLEFIDIKSHTRRKNLKEVRGRVIGTSGKAKKTIQGLTGSVMVVHDNQVGLIVDSEHLEYVCQAVVSLIQGAKHGNVFAYLEKQNSKIRRVDNEDLGLKKGMEKFEE